MFAHECADEHLTDVVAVAAAAVAAAVAVAMDDYVVAQATCGVDTVEALEHGILAFWGHSPR